MTRTHRLQSPQCFDRIGFTQPQVWHKLSRRRFRCFTDLMSTLARIGSTSALARLSALGAGSGCNPLRFCSLRHSLKSCSAEFGVSDFKRNSATTLLLRLSPQISFVVVRERSIWTRAYHATRTQFFYQSLMQVNSPHWAFN